MKSKYFLCYSFLACLLTFLCVFSIGARGQETSPAHEEIPAAQLLQPEELVKLLHSSGSEKPLILQVGSHVLFAEAHIPGSEYVGPGGQETGLRALRDRVKGMSHDQFIVIYCGCCPWTKCPNIRVAYQQLVSLGFTRVKALSIADNFGKDWVTKGYPIAKGR